jgi:hypothetical protein
MGDTFTFIKLFFILFFWSGMYHSTSRPCLLDFLLRMSLLGRMTW